MFGMNSINFSLDIGRENMFVSCDPKKIIYMLIF